jgi:hypothetical protein
VQPSEISIEVRPREGYEAVDLGFRFARAVFRPLFVAHALLVGAVAFALFASLRERPWLMCAVLWWLKPLYDRVALYVLAEALFGRVPSVRETLAALPRLVASTGLVHSLTWLRFSPLRSFAAPVLQLEGLRGRARSERVRVLAGRDARAALGLLFACGVFEAVVLLAGLQLAASFRPEGEALDFWRAALSGESPALSAFEALLYAFAIAAVEPLYVAGGFALYVNRRVWLEGWDVEQAFRKLARRLSPGALVLALALGASTPVAADEPAQEAKPPARCVEWGAIGAKDCIEAVLESEEFSTVEKLELWLPKASEAEPAEPSASTWLFVWLGDFGAGLLRVGAWLSVALFVIALALVVVRSLRDRERPPPAAHPVAPTVRFGLDLRPESLPPDVVAAARERFAAGDAPGALSLLYRGALVHLVHGAGLRIPASATEGECERAARAALDDSLASDFSALTRAWTFCAYARQTPPPEAFAELCERWRPHLGARG